MNDKTLSLAIPLIPLTLYKSTIITYNIITYKLKITYNYFIITYKYLKYLASDLINAKLITMELFEESPEPCEGHLGDGILAMD